MKSVRGSQDRHQLGTTTTQFGDPEGNKLMVVEAR